MTSLSAVSQSVSVYSGLNDRDTATFTDCEYQ